MCLAVPGKIISINNEQEPLMQTGKVSFGGVIKEVSLAYVPDAKVDDYVIVHVGFALSILDSQEAESTLNYLQEMQN
ncbi:MAG: Hydrogenase maturation factor HybG [Chroococcidiopsis cubana SAG 39.79]|uniref:Hydrogenase assembly protein HypC n=1 Tax=Chroococcidiopsis cubana SAG 39.79 TaxID=388085 RepID=A0AB37UL56_9CYAN|nr:MULTISPECIES: HypC/HybG/HupF family hydrogenase formation chaperone [Chroococcidiopsis]MDZ4875901.1 Hydrogenase maturation factor HybG [Chroococcidiopsis cubana SAG 39.79]PSB59804.1 HypC/HybG/HupF family hydrogenase formation chaperone [Chroococcidiopsis cubana CCALA 043]RUT12074.1 hydrogenase assembly protein HypC [Chroococcidiopsis cubana SAG 39.79]URD49184.1 HypC/HybG/HupF family hydrogenase formation chaperone [Chroococcidiopsis sp. CCNUC1]